jgi:hypothetical protein
VVIMRRIRALAACCLLLIVSIAARASAQEAVTLTGHVSSASMPLRGATVQIPELDLTTTTDANGRYSFIIPSSRVRGQAVTITARYLRYRPQSAAIRLVGGALVQDFELRSTADAPAEPPPRAPVAVDTSRRAAAGRPAEPVVRLNRPRLVTGTPRLPVVDSTAFMDLAGSADLGAALAGRLPGVEVRSSSALGGTTAIAVRGQRTLIGLTQPLVVVNGILVDNANVAATSQRVGQGGFDFGSAISDLNPEDVATVELLRGPAAAMRYGGRAANGVLVVTTRSGRGLNGFDVSASQQFTSENALRLPEYQNAYGQGLGGAFAFFNGRGGGINDSVSQSWGPALLGQPIPQASLTEAARAEVRTWIPHPDNVNDYFDRGRTLATNVGVQGANESAQFRLSLANRDYTGLTPQSSLARRSGTITAGYRVSDRLELTGDAQYYGIKGEDRPGTGADESNPVSVFSVMGRQVDVQSLRDHLRDANKAQISWQYVTHNNPYFAALENDNHDERTRWLGGGAATYTLTDWLRGTLRAGADHYTDSRHFTIASGWMGGFPYFAGRGDFSTGGREDDEITATQTNVELWLRGTPAGTGTSAFAFTLGAGRRGNDLNTAASGTDRVPNTTPPAAQSSQVDAHTTFVVGGMDATLLDYVTLALSARQESSSLLSGSASRVYPSVLASVDLARANPSLGGGRLDALTVRGGWSRSGIDALPALVQQLGLTSALAASSTDILASPEVTSGWEVGAELRAFGGRTRADVAYYNERSENLLLPSAATFVRSGGVSNKGIEAQVELIPLRLSRFEWRVGVNYAKNTGLVESLGGVPSLPIGPSLTGMSVEARTGLAPGALVGQGYLRDASGQLLLRDGHPLPDSITGPRVLGTSAPSWIAGLSTGLRVVGVDLSVLFDIRRGGQLFSGSNRAGAFAGVLAETAFRPDTGLLITGTDVATGQANAVHVTTEAYYHSLGAIAERWMYDASFVKLREARASVAVPLHAIGLHAQTLRVAVVGRNLALWTDAPNVDPEFVLSTAPSRGLEMGQLPTVRSVGVQLSLTP